MRTSPSRRAVGALALTVLVSLPLAVRASAAPAPVSLDLPTCGLRRPRLANAPGQWRAATRRGLPTPAVVATWERRFQKKGFAGLVDEAGRGRKESIAPVVRERIIVGATTPPEDIGRWSTRTMAEAAGVSKDTVRRLWQRNDIKPHVTKTFKVSNDPQFETKFWDVIGLYLNPPDRALVLCCDEKSQCQALERTQPSLPLGIGHVRTHTHNYYRHGTVSLFAALNYLDGKVFSLTASSARSCTSHLPTARG
jgi:transposase